MSVSEFSAVLKNEAYKRWFKASETNILHKTVTELRIKEEAAEKTDFLITSTTVKDVVEALTGKKASASQVEGILNKLKNSKPKFVVETTEVDKKGNVKEVYLKFVRLNLEQIGRVVDKAFEEEISTSGRKVSEFFQRGHVVGVATNLVKQTSFGISQSNIPEQHKRLLIEFLDNYIEELQRADLATSNIKDPEHKVYAKYTKNYRRYLVELQPKALNQESGRSVVPITQSLRKYFKPENYVYLTEKNLFKESDSNFFKKLVTSRGSPSMLDLLQEAMVETLKGKNIPNKTFTSPAVEIAKVTTKIRKDSLKKNIKQEVARAKKIKSNLQRLKNASNDPSVLISLQTILDKHLRSQVEDNMGRGDESNVLNYRTGRFANSVKVQRLTMSRQGMITAFYDYMRYPYATFSEGGAQQYPRTRDPKLLISKSIREIASTVVGNRMRSVLA